MVIFVDDEEQVLQSLKRLFRGEPYTVVFATSGKLALEMLAAAEEEVEVIVSDQRMPAMTGTEFLIRSQEFAPNAIRMIMTGYSDIQVTIDAINKGGATRYISKPWDNQEMLSFVQEAIAKYRDDSKLRTDLHKIHEQQRHHQKHFSALFGALTGFIDLTLPAAKRHAAITAEISVGMGVSLGLSPTDLEKIRMAALLHDIGLNTLSSDVAEMDPLCMSATQYALYRSHPVIGQSMIETIVHLHDIALIVRHHHENFDGTGFPDGLAGNAIPQGSAIISLANTLESEMELNGGKLPLQKVLEKVSDRGGTEFDPQLIPHMVRVAEDMYRGR